MKWALLVIDAQNEYFAPYGKWVLPKGPEALEKIQSLLTAARGAGVPVFHITHESLAADAPVFRPGAPGIEIHPALQVLPGERRIVKNFPGSFTQTPLEARLRQDSIEGVIITGFMTHMCCDTTTRQAKERFFAVKFASDATATLDLSLHGTVVPHDVVHHTTLAIMTQFASVATTEDIIMQLKQPVSSGAAVQAN